MTIVGQLSFYGPLKGHNVKYFAKELDWNDEDKSQIPTTNFTMMTQILFIKQKTLFLNNYQKLFSPNICTAKNT